MEIEMEFICKNCKIKFYRNPSAKPTFCSKDCKNGYQRKLVGEHNPNYVGAHNYKIICKTCGEKFRGHKNRIYCSNKCKSKDMQSENFIKYQKSPKLGSSNPNWKGNKMRKVCPNCNEVFRGKRITQRFCCKNCMQEDFSRRMENGDAAWLNQFIKNPSKPQIELFNLISNIFPGAYLNYPAGRYSIDIAVIDENLAIEYDGSYWHDEEKDRIRQEYLEEKGWNFLRYVDRVPTEEEIINDFRKLYLCQNQKEVVENVL